MAYLGTIEARSPHAVSLPALAPTRAEFSQLEWSIIRLAQIDGLWTIRAPGPLRRFWNWLAGRANPALANEKLEALRRMAVLTWHFGFTVPGDDVADFISAGFTPDQYELMVASIRAALSSPRRIPA